MTKELFQFDGHAGTHLPAVIWLPECEPRLILQITHGMTEHAGCYEALAEYLSPLGVVVAGFDLRGHGQNPSDGSIASFGENGWEASIQDMKRFFTLLDTRFPGIHHYMLGFSLGSFLLRDYLGRYPQGVTGAIIMGTGYQPRLLLRIMKAIVKGQVNKVGVDGFSSLVRTLSFGVYNQKFKPGRTDRDWLCSDDAALDRFIVDPLIRRDISAGLFYQMLDAMERTGNAKSYQNWNKEMPVFLLYGDTDPVGNFGKGVPNIYRQMQTAGFTHVQMQQLIGARHLLLWEESCGAAETTRHAIADWLS